MNASLASRHVHLLLQLHLHSLTVYAQLAGMLLVLVYHLAESLTHCQ